MKTKMLVPTGVFCILLGAAAGMFGLHAAEMTTEPSPQVKEINQALDLYKSLQLKPETSIPNDVVAKCKGVIILDRWSGGAGIGATGGEGIGMKKDKDGKFTAPSFYSLGGVSLGAQLGGSNTRTIAFLMSDAAVNMLTDEKFVWSGNVKAVAGPNSSTDSTAYDKADVVLYQLVSGLDVGATFGATKVSIANDDNRKFYANPSLTASDIFEGKVKMPDAAKPLVDALNQQAAAKEKVAASPTP